MARKFTEASSQYLNTTTIPVSAFPFTISAWGRCPSITNADHLVTLVDGDSNLHWFTLTLNGSRTGDPGSLWVRVAAGGDRTETSNSFSADTWHHLCGQAVSATERYCTLDGDFVNQGVDDDASRDPFSQGIDNYSIGAIIDNSTPEYGDAEVAEVGIWNVNLTNPEITMLSNGVSPLLIRPASLVSYIPCVRGGSEIDLISGASLTESASAPTVTAHPRVYKPAKARVYSFPTTAAAVATPGVQIFITK